MTESAPPPTMPKRTRLPNCRKTSFLVMDRPLFGLLSLEISHAPANCGSALEFEIVDVFGGEDRRLAEQDGIILDEFEFSKAAGLHKPRIWL